MRICNNTEETLARNFSDIQQKITNQIDFWVRFNLSLPGRINIAKSLMYSQVNYLGCFLPFKSNEYAALNDLICNFVKGKLNISKKRFFLRPEDGGLGLFDIEEFLMVQKCSWIKRAHNKIDDFWKHRIHIKSDGDVLRIRQNDFSENETPILYCIALCFEKWLQFFWKYNENFRTAPILNNKVLSLNRNGSVPVTDDFFAAYLPEYKDNIRDLRLDNIHNGIRFYSNAEFVNITGIPLSERKLTSLRSVYDTAVIRFQKADPAKKTSIRIEEFIAGLKRGCQKFKKIIYYPIDTIPHNVIKFAENAEIILNYNDARMCNKIWNVSYFANDLRVFLFRFYNNTLGYNYMVSRFVENIEPHCTFCSIARINDLEPETALHIFYSCPFTERLLDVFNDITGTAEDVRRVDIFYRFDSNNIDKKNVLFVLSILFKKYIWDCKLRKCLPERLELINFLKIETNCMLKVSMKFREMMRGSDLEHFFL